MRALVVADNKLGAINHTLLTVEALRKRDIKMIGIIFNGTSGRKDDAVMKDNPRIVRKLTGENVLGALPHLHDRGRLYNAFKPIAKKIIKAL